MLRTVPEYLTCLGPAVLCDGIRERRRSHVPDTAVRQIQGTSRCVSTRHVIWKCLFVRKVRLRYL